MKTTKKETEAVDRPFFAIPMVSQVLTVLFALAFYFQCMILPIVGPAAMKGSGSPGAGPAAHATQNFIAFLCMLLVTLALGVLALYSQKQVRALDNTPKSYFAKTLFVIAVLMLVALLTGLLKT
ncbi:MAG TPA: hypothetical protein DCZ95_10420 [Verrucomicrobia bacterium]|nr:MAG: hypothetical protein A2X46_18725 [Lentisphaerae bacterium GWF2_57_35]HBA84496.1 hypothetical protein [Verrucomicrobiota bacterium]